MSVKSWSFSLPDTKLAWFYQINEWAFKGNCCILWIDITPEKCLNLYFHSHFSMSKNNGIKKKLFEDINLGDHFFVKKNPDFLTLIIKHFIFLN